MPVWPVLMVATAALVLFGWRRGAWQAPAIVFVGYAVTRWIVATFDPAFMEVSICALWLSISATLVYRGSMVPALFLTLSALTYPVFLLFGFRLEYMGLVPIVADGFAIFALLSIGGGIVGLAAHTDHDNSRTLHRQVAHSGGVALRQASDYRPVAKNTKVS